MGNLNREENFSSLTTVLRFIFRQWAKQEIHTARPGIIETYDAATRRARVRAGLRMVLTGSQPGEDGETMEPSVAVNVPVIFPAGGGLAITFPLEEGDPVWLMFSERGLTQWKETYALSTPDKTRFFDESDAIALAGFGPVELTPASMEGATLQTVDGAAFVEVSADEVRAKRGDHEIVIDDNGVTINAEGDVTINVPNMDNVYLGSDGSSAQRLVTQTFLTSYYNLHTHLPTGLVAVPFRAPGTAGLDVTRKVRGE